MQEKNACERISLHLANCTSVLLAPLRCAADPASRFLVSAAPASRACLPFLSRSAAATNWLPLPDPARALSIPEAVVDCAISFQTEGTAVFRRQRGIGLLLLD
jgi:hypothetical protein